MKLIDQLLAQGLTQQQAAELAHAWGLQGVTDLSQIKAEAGGYNYDLGKEGEEGRGQWNIQGEGDRVWMPYESQAVRTWNPQGAGYRLTANGKPMGHFNIENGGYRTTGSGFAFDELQQGGGDNYSQFAYSAAGNDGTEYFISGFNEDGTPKIAARSVSSNDNMAEIRGAAVVAALMGAGASGLLGGGSAGGAAAGEVALSSVPEMVSAGSMGNAAQVIGTIPTVNASTGLLAGGAAAGAAGSGAGTVSAGNGITAGTSSGGSGLYGLNAGGTTTSLAEGLTGSGVSGGTGSGLSVPGLTDVSKAMDWTDYLKTGVKVASAIAGAKSSGDKTQTQNREPWEEAKPWLRDLMARGQELQKYYQNNPFNAQQQQGYNGLFAGLNAIGQQAPGLLSGPAANASGANNYDRFNPRKPLTGSAGFQVPAGLLNFTMPFPKG